MLEVSWFRRHLANANVSERSVGSTWVAIRLAMRRRNGSLSYDFQRIQLRMLEGYFDDSGSHATSKLFVWGGLMGDTAQFAELDRRWKVQLSCPFDGKAPLTTFHASHLSHSHEEFIDYKPAERDVVMKRFRDIIIECGLVPVSFGVSTADWNSVMTGPASIFGTAEQFAFMSCMMSAQRMANISKRRVAMHFDRARLESSRDDIIAAGRAFGGDEVDTHFEAVKESTGLQAADLIAYEAYVFGLDGLNPAAEVEPRPHFKRLLEGAPEAFGFILRAHEMTKLAQFTDYVMKTGQFGVHSGRSSGFQNVFQTMFGMESSPKAES